MESIAEAMGLTTTGLTIVIIIAIFVYMMLVGVTYCLADKYTSLDIEDIGLILVILWPIYLPGLLPYVFFKKSMPCIIEWYNKRSKNKIPDIYIREGAKIKTLEQYSKIVGLVEEYEIENDFENLLNKRRN